MHFYKDIDVIMKFLKDMDEILPIIYMSNNVFHFCLVLRCWGTALFSIRCGTVNRDLAIVPIFLVRFWFAII